MIKRLLASIGILASASADAHTYQDEKVAFELPGQWVTEHEPSAWVALRNATNDAQFIVGLTRIKELIQTQEAELTVVERLAEIRREQIIKLSSGTAEIGVPSHSRVGELLIYDFMAESMAPSVRVYVRLILRNDTIATFSLYEFGRRSNDEFLQLVRSAFSATKVK